MQMVMIEAINHAEQSKRFAVFLGIKSIDHTWLITYGTVMASGFRACARSDSKTR